jgi:hypothetical protein
MKTQNRYFVCDLVERTIIKKGITDAKEACALRDSLAPTEYERRRYACFNYKTVTPFKFLKA